MTCMEITAIAHYDETIRKSERRTKDNFILWIIGSVEDNSDT